MNANNVISENADVALTAHRLLKFTATGVNYAGTTDNPIGSTLNDVESDKAAAVALKKSFGLHFVTVGNATTIAAGDELEIVDANGQVGKLVAGKSIGVAREPSTESGSIIRAYLYAGSGAEASQAELATLAANIPQAGTTDTVAANASDLATAITLANELKGDYNTLRAKLIAAGILS